VRSKVLPSSNPKRIVFLAPILDEYGAARTLYSVLSQIEKEGISCEVWYPKDTKIDFIHLHSFSDSITFRQMNLPVLRRKQVYNINFLLTLIGYITSSFKIRKLTFSSEHSNTVFHIFTAASILGIFLVPRRRRIVSVHEFAKNNFERVLLKGLIRISGSNRIFASHALMNHFGVKGEVIYSGADISVFKDHKKELFKQGDTLNILCVGRIAQTKGQLVLLQALAELIKDYENFHAIFVGLPFRETREYMDACLKFTRLNGLEKNVEFIGEKNDVDEYYLWSHLVVVPSIHPEAFGKVVVEGMASSNVVIATGIGGPLEVIEDKVNGFFVSPNSPQQITETISKVFNSDFDLQTILNDARNRAAYFDSGKTGNRYTKRIMEIFD
jgi:glycosyltransferase involved in cell wall biosynthesis